MKPTLYSAKLNFGKFNAEGEGAKNDVVVTIELRGTPKGHGVVAYRPEFAKDLQLSITGEVWQANHRDIISGGQNYDELLTLVNTPLMHEIVGVWKRWHLNDMNAGDAAQEEYLRKHGRGNDYEATCMILEGAGLLEHDGYKYGSAWKHEELPRDIIQKVMSWEKSAELSK